MLLSLLQAVAAINAAIALASVVVAANVVATPPAIAALTTSLPSMQPLQWPMPLHLLQPLLPSLTLPPLSPPF
jgi:hypothetical protein